MHGLRIAWRQLWRRPALTVVAVVTLGLGLAANGIVFTWVRSILLEAIPGARQPGELVVIAPRHPEEGRGETLSAADIRGLAEESGAFVGATGSDMRMLLVRRGEEQEWVWGQPALANFFEVLGVVPVLGRGFAEGEDRLGRKEQVVVISHRYWRTRMGSRQDVLGQVIHVNERALTVVGVAPPAFRGTISGLEFDLWLPLGSLLSDVDLKAREESRGWRDLHAIARLAPGVGYGEAGLRCSGVAARWRGVFPEFYSRLSYDVVPLWRSPWGGASFFLPALTALGLVGVLLLALVIANLANLQLVRALERGSEMAVRMAVGAGRGRLAAQLLIESLLLGVMGSVLGLVLSVPGARALAALMPPTYLPLQLGLHADWRLVLVLALGAMLASALFGLAPIRHALGTRLQDALNSRGRAGATVGVHRLRQIFVLVQVCLATALLMGMALCIRSYGTALRADLGFDPRGVWLAGFELPEASLSRAQAMAWYEDLRRRTLELPGVRGATLSHWLPMGFEGGDSSRFVVEGYTPPPGEGAEAEVIFVGPRYCETMKTRVISGRDLSEADVAGENTEAAAMVNEEFVRRFWPGREPMGREISFWGGRARVVGVIANGPNRRLGEAPQPTVLVSALQFPRYAMTLVVRTGGDPAALRLDVDRLARESSAQAVPMASMRLEDYVGAAYAIPKLSAVMMTTLGGVALLLAVLGLYAVLAQGVAQRRREFGVRLALGADPRELAWLVVRQGLVLLAFGAGLGTLVAAGLGPLLAKVLVDARVLDAGLWGVVLAGLGVATVTASLVPAWRAARVDPMEALRNE